MDGSSVISSDQLPWTGIEEPSLDNSEMTFPELSINSGLAVTFLLGLFYILYYLSCVVNKPKVVGGRKGLKDHMLKHCPSLSQRYWPRVWAFHCHLSTILRAVYQTSPSAVVTYLREIVPLSDGGELALDWASLSNNDAVKDDMPILLILPGITGCSTDNYVMHIVQDGLLSGYRPVAFNQRGNGGLFLKTLRMYSACNISDVFEVIQRIHQHYPNAPIVGIGVSLGGMILTQYLHQLGNESDLSAVLVFSVPWDPVVSRKSLEDKLDNKVIYSRFIVSRLTQIIQRNVDRLLAQQQEELPFCLESVMKSSTISEFDSRVTVPLFGYSSIEEYYKASKNSDKVHKIRRPYICVTAADDPFVPKHSVPIEEFENNHSTLLIMTSHGGHFGFLEGFRPNIDATWMNRLCRQILTALKHYEADRTALS